MPWVETEFCRLYLGDCRDVLPTLTGVDAVVTDLPNVARFHEWFPKGWRLFAACKNFAQIRPTGVWHSWDPVVFWENGKPPRSGDINRD